MDDKKKAAVLAPHLLIRKRVCEPDGRLVAIHPVHAARITLLLDVRGGTRDKYLEFLGLHVGHHAVRFFGQFMDGGEGDLLRLQPAKQVITAKSAVEKMGGDGTCCELNRYVGRRRTPSTAVLFFCPSDEFAEFITLVPRYVFDVIDIELTEHTIELVGEVAHTRIELNLATSSFYSELEACCSWYLPIQTVIGTFEDLA